MGGMGPASSPGRGDDEVTESNERMAATMRINVQRWIGVLGVLALGWMTGCGPTHSRTEVRESRQETAPEMRSDGEMVSPGEMQSQGEMESQGEMVSPGEMRGPG